MLYLKLLQLKHYDCAIIYGNLKLVTYMKIASGVFRTHYKVTAVVCSAAIPMRQESYAQK